MIDWAATRRRWTITAVALALTIPLVRGPISTMLVARGDALALARDPKADALYERALFVDPENAVAADRLIFRSIMLHDRTGLARGVALSTGLLRRDPQNVIIRMDRALCRHLLGRYETAVADFALVGARTRDPRPLLFAADDAMKLQKSGQAHALLERALRDDPAFTPARLALARIERAR